MKKNSDFSLFTRPGAGTFFTWIALSAGIFFSAYSLRVEQMYRKEVTQKNEVLRRERELSYRLEMATVKIKDSAETLAWSNVQIEQLKKRNDDILEKSANLRKLLYASLKKNQQSSQDDSEEIRSVEPKTAGGTASAVDSKLSGIKLKPEVLFPDLERDNISDEEKMVELVKSSSELNRDSRSVIAEVLTYNPSSRKVFISLGRSNGNISEGNRFAVWRNGEHVTDIRVAQVHAVTSTCEVISPMVESIRSGDIAELIIVSAF